MKSECTGYLKISCYLISENDQPPVHSHNEKIINNEILNKSEDSQEILKVIKNPKLNTKGYVLNVNIVKAEDLPKLGLYRCDSFISVRVGNIIQRTSTVENNQKPVFSTRMVFPVFFPIMNDKIIIKLWDQHMLGDSLIGNIPENLLNDLSFDLNYLQSAGGTIPFKWVNLYGIPKNERQTKFGKMIAGKIDYYEGTDYLGRVLLSLNLIPHERPEKTITYLAGYNEPQSIEYILRADFYELILPSQNESIWIKVKIGNNEVSSAYPLLVKSKGSSEENNSLSQFVYRFRDKDILLEEIRVHFPTDLKQVPDITLNLFVKNTFGEKRLGYVRIKATDKNLKEGCLDWFKFKALGSGNYY